MFDPIFIAISWVKSFVTAEGFAETSRRRFSHFAGRDGNKAQGGRFR
jgi:hypothetical protein